MAVQGLPGDAEFGTQRGHLGLRLPHRRHGQPQLGCRHLEWPPTFAAPCPCGGQPRHRALGDQLPLKLSQGSEDAKDLVDTAVAAGSFKTLATALQTAGLIDTLKGKGPFTVFAPTDEAFAKVPKDQLDALLKDKAKLTAVLTYHVVPGKVMAADVKAGKVKTVQGSEITVTTAGGVKVDAANVVKTDIVADNGVIHVIDSVILPK